MSLRDRIPVEPLEEERLARIERAVVAGLPARRARSSAWRLAAPLAFAAVAAAVVLVVWRAGRRDDAVERTPDPVVVTAAPDGARVDLGDAVITTGAGATFTVTRPDGGVAVHLARGRIELDVAPRKDRPPLVVHADDVEVVVVGTRFTVEWDDEVTVTVAEGLVRVERGGETKMVAAGERWSERARVAVAVAVPEVAEPKVELHDRTAIAPPVPEVEPDVVEVEPPSGKKPRGKDRQTKPPVLLGPLDELRDRIKGQALAPAVDVGLEGEAALAEYRKRAKSGPEPSQALYGMARTQLAMDRANDALRSAQSYHDRFPKGDELEDALWLRLRILCLRKFDERCRTAAHTFVGKYGGESDRAQIAEAVTHTE